jgi:hypothetical protein
MGILVIARYMDGRLIKGTTRNFDSADRYFHIEPPESPYGEGERILYDELKAIFFVKTLEGRRDYEEKKSFKGAKGYGNKVEVKFTDGEKVVGYLYKLDRSHRGVFLYPVDPDSNNDRIFALYHAIESLQYVEGPKKGKVLVFQEVEETLEEEELTPEEPPTPVVQDEEEAVPEEEELTPEEPPTPAAPASKPRARKSKTSSAKTAKKKKR